MVGLEWWAAMKPVDNVRLLRTLGGMASVTLDSGRGERSHMNVSETIERLNLGTFAAEMQREVERESWRSYFERVLADDFTIRRSDPKKPIENKTMFLDAVAAGPGPNRHVVPSSLRTWCSDTVAVAVSLVEVEGRTERFQNCKIFTFAEGEWRCVLWQVTAGP
jgi:hypothetical protein